MDDNEWDDIKNDPEIKEEYANLKNRKILTA